jgi:cystathionine beta-lyase
VGLQLCKAAYGKSQEWLDGLRAYLTANKDYLKDYLKTHLPNVTLIEPEGTYLLWLDVRALGLTRRERRTLLEGKAKVWLDQGEMFGAGGEGFERINIACPRATLTKALNQIRDAILEEIK